MLYFITSNATLKFIREYLAKIFAIAKILITSKAAVPNYLEAAGLHSSVEIFET